MRNTCAAWTDHGDCGQSALPYICGPRCDAHAPWRYGTGHPPPVPDPEQTAAAFAARARGEPMPWAECPHEEPRGARYCALCRRAAKDAHARR